MAKPIINPALDRHPREAALVGRIVLAFGEIEFSVCRNAGQALQMLETVLATVYQTRATAARIDFAQSMIAKICADLGLANDLVTCRSMVANCNKIRNQYAHCNWADHVETGKRSPGLFFADLEDSEFGVEALHHFRHVSVKLLREQLNYFAHTLEWLQFLNHEIAFRQGRTDRQIWPKPPEVSQPPEHNPPEKHIPPWLSKDQSDLFLRHIRAEKNGSNRPTPAQRELERKTAEKRARKAERDARSRSGKK